MPKLYIIGDDGNIHPANGIPEGITALATAAGSMIYTSVTPSPQGSPPKAPSWLSRILACRAKR